jgi:hypothetical protein
MRFSGPELVRIAITLVTLIGVIVLARPCAESMSSFIMSFESSPTPLVKPGTADVPAVQTYEHLTPGMSEAELKAAIERAKARAAGSAAGSASGSAASGGP